jgi:adenosylmethionine-8-amino-7-oxononanoate aminotransferase
VMIRANGDTIAFSPPLIVENNQIEEMFDVTKKAIESIN